MTYPDFKRIKDVCHGMMKPEVYLKIYETAKNTKENTNIAIEIGSAHGAATVCLALGLKDSKSPNAKIFTFDKFSKGGRKHYENEKENQNILLSNLKEFGVNEMVTIIAGDIKDTHKFLQEIQEIDLIMMDSDGQIDRDLGFFYDRLSPDSPIIIDDMADRARVSVFGDRGRLDQKHRLTYLLTLSAVRWGIISQTDMIYQTWFGKKEDKILKDWSKKDILNCYRSLVFGNTEIAYKG